MNDLDRDSKEFSKNATEGVRKLSEAMAQMGVTMQEAADAAYRFATAVAPVFAKATQEAWPELSERRRKLLYWVWKSEFDDPLP